MRFAALAGGVALMVAAPAMAAGLWVPTPADTLQWILQTPVTTTAPATVYDIDGFDNPAATVAKLHGLGKHVICYIDVGTWENFRPDAGAFPKSVLGKPNGWPGERYLDIRRLAVLEPIMAKRLTMCRTKGFDALEPDNIDSFEADTGFPLTGADELAYIRWLISAAHARGLSIGQKNDGDQTGALEPVMDWALLEECFFDQFCGQFTGYTAHHKAVFNTEYVADTSRAKFLNVYCTDDHKTFGYAMELKRLSLMAWRMDCSGRVTQ